MNKFLSRAGVDDVKHEEQLNKTGFWGKRGAGCLVVCPSTSRMLLGCRSKDIEQPLEWAGFGGAIDEEERPKVAALRELREETGFQGQATLLPLFIYRTHGFKFYNYLALVEEEFRPKLDWETSRIRWCPWDNMPSPLHFGVIAVLQDPQARSKLMEYLRG